jgi:tRNA(Leu) C34 or U34 (ribose-2'-O)-methylase TrmL
MNQNLNNRRVKMGSFDEAWQVICDYFVNEKKITEVAYKTWISRIEPKNIDFEKGEITLLVPNDLHRQTLKRCYIPMLEDARSLNLSNSVAIAVYEILRQWDYPLLQSKGELHNHKWAEA